MESVCPGLLQGLRQTRADGEEAEGSLDLLLLHLRKSVQLGQEEGTSCYHLSHRQLMFDRHTAATLKLTPTDKRFHFNRHMDLFPTSRDKVRSIHRTTNTDEHTFVTARMHSHSEEDTHQRERIPGSFWFPGIFFLLLLCAPFQPLVLCHLLIPERHFPGLTILYIVRVYFTNWKNWKLKILSYLQQVWIRHWEKLRDLEAEGESGCFLTHLWFFSSYHAEQRWEESDRLSRPTPLPPSW